MDARTLFFDVGEIIRRISLTTAIAAAVLASVYAASRSPDAMVRMSVLAMGLGIVWSGIRKNRLVVRSDDTSDVPHRHERHRLR
jgi:hypothetical protein